MITKYNRLMFLLLFLASSIIINSQTILYVTQNGAGTKDGSSWSNALSEVADALKYAKQNEDDWTTANTLQIWVATGTYKPKYSPNDGDNFKEDPTDARDVSFLLVNNVQLYGGFTGTETDLTARNWNTNKTILSGDIGIVNDDVDNAYNVVISFGKSATEPITEKTIVDGFTISGGTANGDGERTVNGKFSNRQYGGGMYNDASSPTLTNVTLSGNTAANGGGMLNWNSSPTFSNVTISMNGAIYNGGGVFNYQSSPTLTYVILSGNIATEGGGMYNYESSPTLTNVTLSGNTAQNGGGMYNYSAFSPTLTNVTISGNTAGLLGSGMYNWNSSPTLTNVTLSGNTASNDGGGMFNQYFSTPKIYNSIILGNNSGIVNSNTDSSSEIKNSLVQGLTATSNGNLNATNVNATDIFVDYQTATAGNPTSAGDFRLKNGAIVINKGDNSLYNVATFGDKDLAGNPRIFDGTIDLGAFEYQPVQITPTNNILYVTQNGAGFKDGSSWSNALSEVADALKYAKENETQWTTTNTLQIWVAAGTYKPKYSPNDGDNLKADPTDPRDVSFLLVNNVQLYGGFTGTETDRTTRNWATNKTILSGDIGIVNYNVDNAYNVVLSIGKSAAEPISANTILDGFTITGGNANKGLALTVTVNGISFSRYDGGGILNRFSSLTLTSVTISGNRATVGGGMLNVDSSPTLTNVILSGNTAILNGGGMFNSFSFPTLMSVTLSGNTANNGGGMSNLNYSKPKIYNSIILGNNTGIFNANATNDVPDIRYSLVQGLTETSNGNLNAIGVNATDVFIDYQTATAGNPTTAGDFSLKDGAIVINKGNNSLYNVATFGDKDLAGNPRIVGTIDMGAFENQGIQITPTNNILYVTQNGAGTKDGSSWSNALSEVADALKYAKENETDWTETNTLQIWVAEGTYKPKYSPNDGDNLKADPTDPRDVSFLLVNNVQLYGGFAGTETEHNARNWETNKTILSGDIGIVNDDVDNAYNVVISFGKSATEPITEKTIVDGFTISGGTANGDGERTVNGKFSNRQYGGGMYNDASSPTLTNVTLSGNTAANGGGMLNWNSSPTFSNVTISMNGAIYNGGGVFNYQSSPTFSNVTISMNGAIHNGGGVFNYQSSPTLTNVILSGNIATEGGGMYNQNSSPTLTNVTLSGNTATQKGGGMYNNASFPTLTNVTLSGNTANNYGGGMYNENSSPTLTNVTLSGNTAMYGGGMYNWGASPTLTNVTLSGNTAMYGGGMYNFNSSPTLTNVTLSGNTAMYGGGMYNWGASPTLTNVTLSGNTASNDGGGMYNANSSKPKIYSSIILGNNSGIVNDNTSTDVPDIQYSLVQGLTATDNGNLDATGVNATDVFVDYQSATIGNSTTSGDFSLKDGAIVINKGNNTLYDVTVFGDKDLAGNPRIVGSAIDMGAYENQVVLSTATVERQKDLVYPNPTTGIFFVRTDKESKAVLYDLSGKLLKTISLKKGENQLDITNLTKGMYLLKTENGTFKVIKQ